ncbi:MAG: rRNA biogenesis protein rrp36 [Sclerophora amabilis]|nr:MAG: rRNA biogenesis protein rrp36 [Sclerophora amabilis]
MASRQKGDIGRTLQRPIRPRQDDSDPEISTDDSSNESSLGSAARKAGYEGEVLANDDDASDLDERSSSSSGDESIGDDIGAISFGALAKAQQSIGKRKRGSNKGSTGHSERLDAVRQRLRALKEEGGGLERKTAGKDDKEEYSTKRSSKHAPTIISSKRAVSRKREVLPMTKLEARDPRFDSLSGPVDSDKMRKNYAFLEEYRDEEMKQLKHAIKRTKDEEAKEKLKKQLLSMFSLIRQENKKKSQASKDKRQEILRSHRAAEKELVKQGKKPFYLKKAEQSKLALISHYDSMKSKQRDRAMERRRKKNTARDRKGMPVARRTAE